MALTPERIEEISREHLHVVGAGYVRPSDATGFARAIEAEVRRDALEEAATACESLRFMSDKQRHDESDCAAAIRKLKEDIQ